MLPDNVLSSKAIVQGYPDPVKQPGDFLVDWERAGKGLRDPSDGLLVQVWRLDVERDANNVDLWHFNVSAPNFPKQTVLSHLNVTEASLSFDQNMNPFIAFMAAGLPYMYWYDSSIPGQVVVGLPPGIKSPRCTIDDKRSTNFANSDNLLAYTRNGNLCVCYQRDRYGVEHVLCEVGEDAELVSCAMTSGSRVQFRVRKVTADTSDDQYSVQVYPLLSDIVLDLCSRAGIPAENLDVNDLYGEFIVGYPVVSDDDVAGQLEPLSQAFFFDPTEYDKKLRFLRRGRDPVGRFTFRDLVDRDPGAFKQTVIQEDKLPKQVEVSHLDPDGGFGRNTQRATRKSNMVKAKGNEEVDLPFAATADQAATIALKRIKMQWHEPVTYEFWLPISFTEWTPADSVEYVDEENNVYPLRLETRNEDTGILKFTAKKDGRGAVYGTSATGLALPPPISTTPGLVGETRLEILNIPVLRDQDDELGVYVGVAGSSSAWYGADVLISSDGGVNYYDAFSTEQPATLGDTETALAAEISAEYGDDQAVIVKVNYGLESVDYASLLNNYNRCVIGDEVLQFQTAVHLGDNRYRLSGLVRGRYNTEVAAWPAGTRFVLLDSTITFLQAQQWMLGTEIYLKPVSYGLTEDESTPTAYDFDVAMSQREWPPHYLRATRDGSDSVTVTWIPRPRLGVETSPRNSKYFTGYKIRFSDGFVVTVGINDTTYTRTSTPAGVTITVCGMNSIAGDGDESEGVTV